MAGVPETLRTGSCLPQHVNLPYMQEGEREGIVEGDLGGAQRRDRENTRGLRPPLSLAASPRGVPLPQDHCLGVVRLSFLYRFRSPEP
jgi:hypothetical protein